MGIWELIILVLVVGFTVLIVSCGIITKIMEEKRKSGRIGDQVLVNWTEQIGEEIRKMMALYDEQKKKEKEEAYRIRKEIEENCIRKEMEEN